MTLPVTGLTNPSLSYNVTPISDYSAAHPFIDLMKNARPLLGSVLGGWGEMSHDELVQSGVLDADGWPTALPIGIDKIETIWSMGSDAVYEGMDGRYVATWKGEGDLLVTGADVTIVEQTANRVVFDLNAGKLQLVIKDTDPNGTGDYIRDVSVVREEHVALHEAGAIFNPEYLALLEDARQLRFMDWMNTNNSTVTSWDVRQTPDSVTWMTDGNDETGVPVEIMVALANQVGADPWFSLPIGADAEFVTNFATYVRDHLDPNLTATFELSNETWNPFFNQFHDLKKLVKADWGPQQFETQAIHSMYTKLATTNALLIDQVYGAEADTRVQHVLGTQASNGWVTKQRVSAHIWEANEPGNYVDPTTVFDAIAGTSYFGSRTLSRADMRDELAQMIADPAVDAEAWLYQQLLDPSYQGSVPYTLNQMQNQADIAHSFGMDLVLYEGGQHVHHQWSIPSVPVDMESFMIGFVRSQYMADLYQALWDGWEAIGDGPFMQFTDVGPAGQYGSWGTRQNLYDDTPRSLLLDALNASTPAWFDTGGEHHQQGVTVFGDDSANSLDGTTQEDFLIGRGGNDVIDGDAGDDGLHGGAGDDILIGGTGDDRIVGGDGTDHAVYGGTAASYSLALDADGRLVVTALDGSGSDTVSGVEFLDFADGIFDVAASPYAASLDPSLSGGSGGTDPVIPDPGGLTGDEDFTLTVPFEGAVIDGKDGTDTLTLVDPDNSGGLYITSLNYWNQTRADFEALYGHLIDMDGEMSVSAYFVGDLQGTITGFTPTDPRPENNLDDAANLYGLDVALMNGAIGVGLEAIFGSGGDDIFYGRKHDDVFYGGVGWDKMTGGAGNDELHGGVGTNKLFGNAGDDVFVFGGGIDWVRGGNDADLYDFSDYYSSTDVQTSNAGPDTRFTTLSGTELAYLREVETVRFADGDFTLANDVLTLI